MRKHKDRLPGGKADNSQPQDFDSKELARGIEVESEHTSDPQIAMEIAMDHLKEDPRYYSKLKKIHKEAQMDFRSSLNWLRSLRESLLEGAAKPPPIPQDAMRKRKKGTAGLAGPGSRRTGGVQPGSDVDTALKIVRKGVSQTIKAKTPPPIPPKRKSDTGKALDVVRRTAKADRSAFDVARKTSKARATAPGQTSTHLPGVSPESERPGKRAARLRRTQNSSTTYFGSIIAECRMALG